METLVEFLGDFRVEKGSPANLGSLQGGLYNIPPEKAQEFYELYLTAAKTFTEEKHTAFVFRPAESEKQPLCIDLDVKTEHEVPIAVGSFVKYAERMASLLTKHHEGPIKFLVVTKQSGYFKKVKHEKFFCTGGHVYYPDVRISLADAKQVRLASLDCVDQIFGHLHPCNDEGDIVDQRIPHRSNGLMLIGDYKSRKHDSARGNFGPGGLQPHRRRA